MSVSFEALAMAGLDYNECDMSMEEWEQSEMMIPPHLLAQEEEEKEESGDHISLHGVQELFRSSSKTDDQSRGKCSARKDQLPIIISRVKKTNLVKQLSSKKMMMVEIIGSYLTYASLGLRQT
ncbi:hypothetical protein POM88_037051 [Heracleum sosnowskyi]|uniref:Uncharacterized protein n=1 Tax=Heracleum sosnowskyi TaxID=360622 RepID=A0AAD8HPI3_9APIA|nr:hypothetical protein POM88_037051 [Heracleum sosnowskyi]